MQALYSWDVGHADPAVVLMFPWYDTVHQDSDDSDENVPADDLSFPRLIVQGTLDHIEEVDQLIRTHLDHWDIERLARVDLSILRMSVYCLRFQTMIPAHVTIDEAVELAKELSTDDAYRFINGVLDGVRRHLQHVEK